MVNCINQWEFDTIMPLMEGFLPFLAQVRVWLIVINGGISPKKEMASHSHLS